MFGKNILKNRVEELEFIIESLKKESKCFFEIHIYSLAAPYSICIGVIEIYQDTIKIKDNSLSLIHLPYPHDVLGMYIICPYYNKTKKVALNRKFFCQNELYFVLKKNIDLFKLELEEDRSDK